MAFDVATGRIKVGLEPSDTSQDADIQMALNTALSLAEQYCDRKFAFARETLTKYADRFSERVFVDRFPINRIYSITGAGTNSPEAHHDAGVVFTSAGSNPGSKITIDYEGGYKSLPADLEYCLWQVFAAVWADFDPTNANGGNVVVSGEIKKRSIVGVGSVEYTTSADSIASTTVSDWSAVLPGATQAVLNLYKRRVA